MDFDQHLSHAQKRLAAGEWAAARKPLEELVGCFSDQALPRFLLGATLHALGERGAAIDALRKAIELAPEFVPALNALATVLVEEGLLTEVPQDIPYRIARIIGDRYAAAVAEIAVQFAYRRNAGRIRIGYLSADYWEHLNAYLSYPLFRLHDRSKFEVSARDLLHL